MARNHLFFVINIKLGFIQKVINFIGFQRVSGSDDPWFCFKYSSNTLLFGKLNNQNFTTYHQNQIELILKMSSIAKIMALMKYKKLKLILVLSLIVSS